MKAKKLLDAAPRWFQRDADRYGAGVDLRNSSGYRELMGNEFFEFFRDPVNYEGTDGEWKWTVRRVDGLINLYAQRRKQ